MKEDKLISVLIGLVGACNNNPKTDNTDRVVIKSLAFPLLFPNFGDDELSELLDEIRAEKYAIAPGCAECITPCGNTSDYDMNRIYQAEDDIREIKLQILSKLRKMAAREYSRIQENSQ
ncbi:MAG: hydroxylamine reductase, partial [Oscillospiraceae bacterium]|nr:hydroxylamine reductase [Oscillospiraceae bacterium]